MSNPPEYFARIAARVNFSLLQSKLVVVVGIGTVGSQIALELARCGVGRFRLIDGDHLEEANRARHVLPEHYVGMNKAKALTVHLADEVPQSRPEAVPLYVDDSLSDRQLDKLLADADLIVAATDDRDAQRRLGRRALALSVPAIFPALYGDDGGEVIVQLDPRFPCFFCWDGFRTNEERLRGVAALNADTLPVIHTAVRLSLGILDPRSEHREMMMWAPNQPPRQVFVQERFVLDMGLLTRRLDCPSCGVGPATGRGPLGPVPLHGPSVRPEHHPSGGSNSGMSRTTGIFHLIAGGIAVLAGGLLAGMLYLVGVAALLLGALWLAIELLGYLFTGHFA